MAEFDNGLVASTLLPIFAEVPGRTAGVYKGQRPTQAYHDGDPTATGESIPLGGAVERIDQRNAPTQIERDNGLVAEAAGLGFETWWESFHVIPRDFVFGNLLSTQNEPIYVYSAFRRMDHDWTVFTNNAGAGVSISGLPTLPQTFVPQSDAGLTLTLIVSTSGQPVVDSTLDFTFGTVSQTIGVPISLQRVVLFSVQPELPFTERLQWNTEVQGHIIGTEKRLSGRKNPRQMFEWNFVLEDDGVERAFFHNVLFDWQARVFGLPIWSEATHLTQIASSGTTTLNVAGTAYADYRVGGLLLVFTGRTTFDVLELQSSTATSLTTVSGVLNTYPAGTLVMPLRTGVAKRQIQGNRFVSGAARLKMQFRVEDNDANLADTSAFNSYNSKVLIDGCNSVRVSMSETFDRDLIVFDHLMGVPDQSSPWDVGRRVHQLALLAKGKQNLWEHRQLLHALRGRQVSFYVCSFTKDFVVDSDISSGTLLNVANVGYTQFVQSRQPRNVIRIVYNNGDPDDIREIVSSSVVDATREALTLDSSIAARPMSEVEKIMYVEKVRWDSDSLAIRHELGTRDFRITGPVKSVLE